MLATLALCSSMLANPADVPVQPGPAPVVQMGYEGDNILLKLSQGQLRMAKLVSPGGGVSIVLDAQGDRVAIEMGRKGLTVQRGGRTVRVPFGDAAVLPSALESARRLLTGSMAVGHFRELVARSDRSGAEGVLVLQLFLTESVVAIAEGDVDGPTRLRARLKQRRDALAIKRAGFTFASLSGDQQRDCTTEYEKRLLEIDSALTSCEQSADSQEWFYERMAQRLLCHAEFIAASESAIFQFAACSALPKIAG